MIKAYKVSEDDENIRCACEIECEGGAVQFKAELSAIFKGIHDNPLLTYLMTEVLDKLMGEGSEENESKRVN